MLNLYRRITKLIAEEVRIELSPGMERRLSKNRSVDPVALEAFLKGRANWELHSEEETDSALFYFRIVAEKDPDWAESHAGMAIAYHTIGQFAYGPVDESFGQAKINLDKALELDPNSANSHFVRAMNHYEQAYETNKGLVVNLATYAIPFPELKDNPRYLELLDKMDLPLIED